MRNRAAALRLDRQPVRKYVLRRLLVAIPSPLIASFIVFSLPRLLPGDVGQLTPPRRSCRRGWEVTLEIRTEVPEQLLLHDRRGA